MRRYRMACRFRISCQCFRRGHTWKAIVESLRLHHNDGGDTLSTVRIYLQSRHTSPGSRCTSPLYPCGVDDKGVYGLARGVLLLASACNKRSESPHAVRCVVMSCIGNSCRSRPQVPHERCREYEFCDSPQQLRRRLIPAPEHCFITHRYREFAFTTG